MVHGSGDDNAAGGLHAPPKLPSKRSRTSGSVSARLGVLLPRPKRRRQPYFVAREAGEQLREWVRRNLEDAPGCFYLDGFLALLSLFVVVFNVYAFWDGVAHSTASWMIGWCSDIVTNLLEDALVRSRVRLVPLIDLDAWINLVFTIE